ncbi:D-alanyl-D-alanine carboxypeptidase [Candidatus Microgenomates bacterium]|nr:D-alanyl-D-alanine carboxypeptidase [Candidatus Microgenomates bacterium]
MAKNNKQSLILTNVRNRKFFKENYVFLTDSFWKKISLLRLSALTFILLATNMLVADPDSFPRIDTFQITAAPIPQTSISRAPSITAATAIVYDPKSAVVLYDKNVDSPIPPASTTKIVTALVALNNYNLQDIFRAGDLEVDGQTMRLVSGEEMTVEGLLNGLLIFSANDAAEVLADNFPGGREKFVEEMNKVAQALNLTNTRFKNPSGLFDYEHVSTARDLARLAAFAINNLTLADIVKTRERTVVSVNGANRHKLTNLNSLLWSEPGVVGIKTGTTEEGGEALVTFVERDSQPLVVVVLGSTNRFSDTKRLIGWVYENYKWASPVTARSSR